jgi:ribose transport system substrate-binding protein
MRRWTKGYRASAVSVGIAMSAVSVVGVSACGSSSSATKTQTSSASAGSTTKKPLKLGVELFDTSDAFSQEIAKGARAAAKQFGATVEIQGPTTVDPPQAQAQVQSLLTTGLAGIAIGPEPAPLWTKTLSNALSSTKGNVVTFTSPPIGDDVKYYVGINTYTQGEAIADSAIKVGKVPASTTGDVLVGICVPDSTPLQQTTSGMVAAVKAALPHAKIIGPVNVGIVPNQNLAAWQSLVRAHPNTVLALGPCDADAPNLATVKKATGGHFALGTTDISEPSVLTAIKSGVISSNVAQNWYLQGYTAIRLLIDRTEGKNPKPGWYDTGTTTITAANANVIAKRDSSTAALAAWNAPLIKAFWSNINSKAQPLSGAQNPK